MHIVFHCLHQCLTILQCSFHTILSLRYFTYSLPQNAGFHIMNTSKHQIRSLFFTFIYSLFKNWIMEESVIIKKAYTVLDILHTFPKLALHYTLLKNSSETTIDATEPILIMCFPHVKMLSDFSILKHFH